MLSRLKIFGLYIHLPLY